MKRFCTRGAASLAALTFALLIISISTISMAHADLLADELAKHKVVPDHIDYEYFKLLRINVNGNDVKPGASVPAKNVKNIDTNKLSWPGANDEARYTILLLDLDRKPLTNRTSQIYNQYTNINVPGQNIQLGQSVVAFEPPVVPCFPTTKHRILALTLHQSQNIDLKDIVYISASAGQSSARENFDLKSFIERHRLDPVAANMFLAYGDAGGVCNGATTLRSLSLSHLSLLVVVAMVMGATSLHNPSRRL